jgi:flagellar biosynthesis anti-sigma factor FlgM
MAALDGISTLATSLGSLNGSVNGTSSAAAAAAAAANSAKTEKSAEASPAAVKDQPSVSSTGGLVAQALNTSDVRQEKVSALQSAIASGSYNVPSSEVASKIVDSLLK